MSVPLPYPLDWQQRSEYVRDRIDRLKRALWSCRGRAAWIKSKVEEEIERLSMVEKRLHGSEAVQYGPAVRER